MVKTAVLAITKNGISLGHTLKNVFQDYEIYAPEKFSDGSKVNWFSEKASVKIRDLFLENDVIVCVFSLGAAIRLLSPYLKSKKEDPAVIVIDDKGKFVISVLSGHLGGANKKATEIANKLDSIPVITTAAEVNKTIPVDLVGNEFGWKIDDDANVTKISACMVNEEKIGIFQDAGEENWWTTKFPDNVKIFKSIEELFKSNSQGMLIITDKILDEGIFEKSIVYRPQTLVVGIGLHQETTDEDIKRGVDKVFEKFSLSKKSISTFATIDGKKDVIGLLQISKQMSIPIESFSKDELSLIKTPNPSKIVRCFEGTSSVSEAASLIASKGELIVEKQKFPPNLTIAVARILK